MDPIVVCFFSHSQSKGVVCYRWFSLKMVLMRLGILRKYWVGFQVPSHYLVPSEPTSGLIHVINTCALIRKLVIYSFHFMRQIQIKNSPFVYALIACNSYIYIYIYMFLRGVQTKFF